MLDLYSGTEIHVKLLQCVEKMCTNSTNSSPSWRIQAHLQRRHHSGPSGATHSGSLNQNTSVYQLCTCPADPGGGCSSSRSSGCLLSTPVIFSPLQPWSPTPFIRQKRAGTTVTIPMLSSALSIMLDTLGLDPTLYSIVSGEEVLWHMATYRQGLA